MKKQIILFFLMLLSMMASAYRDYDAEIDGIFYKLNSANRTAEVTYYSSEDYEDYVPFYSGDIVIPAEVTYNNVTYSVTSIGIGAFEGCCDLTSVIIGNKVTSIDVYAFYGCSSLTSVTIPNSVTSIGGGAFYETGWYYNQSDGLLYLDNWLLGYKGTEPNGALTIRNGTRGIAEEAFLGSNVISLLIPESLTFIGNSTFAHCGGLTSIVVESNNPVYDSRNNCHAIIDTNTNTLMVGCINTVIPESVTSIGGNAFSGRPMTSITIPNSVTSIGGNAFMDCYGLTSVTIPNSVTSIAEGAFMDCRNLESVTIGSSVSSIGDEAFLCRNLNSVTSLIEEPFEISEYIFSYGEEEAHFPSATLYVPVGTKAKYQSTKGWKKFKEIIEIGFQEDENHIVFADAKVKAMCVANWDTDGNGMLSYEEAAAVTDLGSVFEDNADITSFDELQYFTGLTSIGDFAFHCCSGLTSVTIPQSVTSIGYEAFSGCSGLTSVTIPGSVTSIGGSAFKYTGWYNNQADGFLYLGNWLLGYKGDKPNGALNISDGTRRVANSAFNGCSGLTSVTIPNSVTSIGDYVFKGCRGLTSVVIPNSMTSIGDGAFESCRNLTSVHISDLAAWCNISFSDCDSNPLFYAHHLYMNGTEITELEIPNNVTAISDWAFCGCNGLTSVTIPNSLISIGIDAFTACENLITVTSFIEEPFEISEYVFYCDRGGDDYPTLYVPAGTKVKYQATKGWKEFKEILEIGGVQEDENHITFADANVKALCVANWDTDENGMLSYEEAAAVTDLGSVFEDNADITSFDELRYFTALTTIGDNAFFGCSKLASITLPENIVSIGDYAFASCKALTTFTIPANVSEIGSNAFRTCTGLTDVYCLPQEVPTTASNAFYNSNIGNATLHVVVSSYNAYKAAVPWKNFKNMLGDIPALCAVPVISYVEGKLVFTSETEGVKFNSSITCEDIANREDCSEIDLCVTYLVSVYATKEGYTPSETATATLCWIDTEPVEGVVTDILEIAATPVLVQNEGGTITVTGVGNGQAVSVYNLSGQQMGSATGRDGKAVVSTSMHSGEVAVVKIGQKAVKIRLR